MSDPSRRGDLRAGDLQAHPPGDASGDGRGGPPGGQGPGRSLQGALDVRLDALMTSLVSAGQAGAHRDGPAGAGVPWQRWLADNLDLALVLAAVVMQEDTDVCRGGHPDALGVLASRYEAINDRLRQSLEDPGPDQDPSWRATVDTTLSRCRTRLEEIHAQFQLVAGGLPLVIPGEFLG